MSRKCPRSAGVVAALWLLAAVATACSTSATASAPGPGWSWLGTDQIATNAGAIYDVSCASPKLCVAVGPSDGTSGTGELAVTFNGSRWSLDRLPTVPYPKVLSNVSCSPDGFCMAIDTVSESFFSADGHTWKASPLIYGLNPAIYQATSSNLSCSDLSFCMASNDIGITDVFQNGAWQAPNHLSDGANLAPLCRSSSFCVSIGSSGAYVYSNGVWSNDTSSSATAEVSCLQQGRCQESNGVVVPASPLAGSLLSCVSQSFCMALASFPGTEQYSYAVFKGTWSKPQSIPHASFSGLYASPNSPMGVLPSLDCTSSAFCILVGPTGQTWVWRPAGS